VAEIYCSHPVIPTAACPPRFGGRPGFLPHALFACRAAEWRDPGLIAPKQPPRRPPPFALLLNCQTHPRLLRMAVRPARRGGDLLFALSGRQSEDLNRAKPSRKCSRRSELQSLCGNHVFVEHGFSQFPQNRHSERSGPIFSCFREANVGPHSDRRFRSGRKESLFLCVVTQTLQLRHSGLSKDWASAPEETLLPARSPSFDKLWLQAASAHPPARHASLLRGGISHACRSRGGDFAR
jgi:hypothetical protein